MVDLTQLSDDDLRAALFDALVGRLEAKAQKDPSIALVNHMPTVLAVSRRGNLLTLSQGLGPWLLRGDLKFKDRRERLRTFNVARATIQSRLAITPDRVEGTPDEILDKILAMFLEWTAAEEESPQAVVEHTQQAPRVARPESAPAAGAPQTRPTLHEATQEPRATSARSSEERENATPPKIRESERAPVEVKPPTSIEVTDRSVPDLQMAEATTHTEAAPPPPEPFREMTTPTLRTYQLLFETARRELDEARSLPGGNRYFLLGAGVFVALTAEAFLNDLGSRVIPSWSQMQRLDPREKAEVLNIELFNDKVDWNTRPFQSVAAALGFRRALAYAYAETLSSDQRQTADREASEVPRTRRTSWPEHCDVATIQRWITDIGLVIEHFSRGHDPSEVAVGTTDQPPASQQDN